MLCLQANMADAFEIPRPSHSSLMIRTSLMGVVQFLPHGSRVAYGRGPAPYMACFPSQGLVIVGQQADEG